MANSFSRWLYDAKQKLQCQVGHNSDIWLVTENSCSLLLSTHSVPRGVSFLYSDGRGGGGGGYALHHLHLLFSNCVDIYV